jgi:hypothetical protein
MIRKATVTMLVAGSLLVGATLSQAADREIAGVKFPEEITVQGQPLQLNGVAVRTKFFIKVFAGGFYLQHPTRDAQEAITSEQIKRFELRYLTNMATAKKLQEGFIEAIEEANPKELVAKHKAEIDRYASWLDPDMKAGETSVATYVPGKGLTLVYMGVEKGTIADPEFVQMYFRYNLGEKADEDLREGYLGQ